MCHAQRVYREAKARQTPQGDTLGSDPAPGPCVPLESLSPVECQQMAAAAEASALADQAEKVWRQLDQDGSGTLEDTEALRLAEWIWGSFRPGVEISQEEREEQAKGSIVGTATRV